MIKGMDQIDLFFPAGSQKFEARDLWIKMMSEK